MQTHGNSPEQMQAPPEQMQPKEQQLAQPLTRAVRPRPQGGQTARAGHIRLPGGQTALCDRPAKKYAP